MDTERGLSGLERGSKLQTHGNGGALALPVATFNEKTVSRLLYIVPLIRISYYTYTTIGDTKTYGN